MNNENNISNKKTSDEENAKELQSKFYEYQILESQIKQLQEQIEHFDAQIIEVNSIKNNLDSFNNSAVDSEILVPVANGIFAKAVLKDNNDLVVNVGANVAVHKSVEDTKNLLQQQFVEIQNYRMQLFAQLEILSKKIVNLEKDLELLIK